jgi:signal transduction histidine kinase
MEQRPLVVAGERARIATIVRNLIDNAVKFSPDGGNVLITGRADPETHRASIAVSDAGIGVAPEERARLFERFSRLSAANRRGIEGTGLGLFLSRQIARLHGGDITMEGNTEGGSTFTLQLPLAGPRPGFTAFGGQPEDTEVQTPF